MLLGSPPDMVHGSRLRKTRSSTQKTRAQYIEVLSSKGNPPLL